MPSGLQKIVSAGAALGSKIAKPQSSEAAGLKAKKEMIDEYNKAVSGEPAQPKAAPMKPAAMDLINPKGQYGDRPGEKRIDVRDMVKPLMSYKDGTASVPKTGPAILHKGEMVVPKEMNPFELVKGHEDKKPPKKVKHISVRRAGKGYIAENHHTMPEHHPMEEHPMMTMKDVQDHMQQHMGDDEATESGSNAQEEALEGE